MTKNPKSFNARSWRSLVGALALICAASFVAMAQTPYTPGGTVISNTATSTYSDGTDNFETTSNTVSVTVTNIAGLAITPDAGTQANVARGQTGVDFLFTITNTGNFTNQVVFKGAGASIIKTGSATVTAAVIDVDGSNTINAGDTDIFANGADVTSANVLQDGTLKVIVRIDVLFTALGGSTINIQLGDAPGTTPWDNQPLAASAADVRTGTAGTTNGQEEARGDITVTLDNSGSVLIGTRVSGVNYPAAVGTTDMNDYTNKSVTTGIMVAPGANTDASGVAIFTNSVKNTGNSADTFTFTAPTIPAGFTVEISFNAGSSYADMADGTPDTLLIAYDTTVTVLVRVTAPSGKLVLTGYPTTVRVASGITPAAFNETIDRLYTGYLSLSKGQTVANATGRGGATEAVPGATIAYVVTYDNASVEDGGTNTSPLSAGTVVMTDAVPANTDFDFDSAGSTVSAGTFTYSSATTGTDFTYTPVTGGGTAPAGFDRNVKRVRFTKTGAMAPADAASTISFTVRIR